MPSGSEVVASLSHLNLPSVHPRPVVHQLVLHPIAQSLPLLPLDHLHPLLLYLRYHPGAPHEAIGSCAPEQGTGYP